MNVTAQKFQSQNGPVGKPSARSNHRTTLPQSALRAAGSLREGAGRGCVPFIAPPGNRNVAGDFHRPYEIQRVFHFTIQPGAR